MVFVFAGLNMVNYFLTYMTMALASRIEFLHQFSFYSVPAPIQFLQHSCTNLGLSYIDTFMGKYERGFCSKCCLNTST